MRTLYRTVKKRNNVLLFVGFLVILTTKLIGIFDHLFTTSFANYKHRGPNQPLEWLIYNFQSRNIVPTNPYNHSYAIISEHCAKDLIIVVKTRLDKVSSRDLIRETWGDTRRYKNFSVAVVFLVGSSPENPVRQRDVVRENGRHGDIIQGSFRESYYNLTIKTQMGLHWLNTHCRHFKYALFVDDDVYLSPTNVLKYLIDPHAYPSKSTIKDTDIISGQNSNFWVGRMPLWNWRLPIRFKLSKWSVSLHDYPYTIYPPFINGGVQFLSKYSTEKLYYASLFTDFYKFEDVFLGMAAYKAGIDPVHSRHILNWDSFRGLFYTLVPQPHTISVQDISSTEKMRWFWDKQESAGNT